MAARSPHPAVHTGHLDQPRAAAHPQAAAAPQGDRQAGQFDPGARADPGSAVAVFFRREGQDRASPGARQACLRQATGSRQAGRCPGDRARTPAAEITMTGATRSGSRTKRPGAHRAPRTRSYPRRLTPAGPGNGNTRGTSNQARGGRAGAFGVALRSRSTLVRLSVLTVAAALVGVGLARPGISSAEPTVAQFLLAWQSRHYLAAAGLTTGNPRVVAAALASAYRRLDASNVSLSIRSVSQRGRTARAGFQAAIDLSGSGLLWTYPGGFALRDGSDGWRVLWSPSVIVPGMTDKEQLAVVSQFYPRSEITDSAGQSLIVPSKVYQVGVYPGMLADPARTAAALSEVTQIPADQIEGQIEENPQ